ncbi:erythromycin esterase family protein [Kribbella deserti]|uniref:Erythromycin esterase family protein n=1 Tax=Kribbella deserti TaxID=1926257 RepID=A0ABV6QGC2_9ACTN
MTQDIRDLLTTSCELLALGEPTHQEPAFPQLRNDLFAQLTSAGFRSIALETDRVAAYAVDAFVQHGKGSLEMAMREGFSHGLGTLEANRQLVAWMCDYNDNRPANERLTFHGFDTPVEMMSAPSPRAYLEYARDFLGLDVELASLVGADELWSRSEAILDPAESIGATPEADRLQIIADDLLTELYARAPERTAATSRAEWFKAKTHLTAGLGLLRYHRQSAQRMEPSTRVSRLLATRDALMAQNLFDIRAIESRRGPTLVFAQNLHLQRNPSRWRLAGMDLTWFPAGAIVSSVVGDRYTFVAGSLGSSAALGLGEPSPDTYEGLLQSRISTWGLTAASTVAPADVRTDTKPEQGYFPLDRATVNCADAILHINAAQQPAVL